MGVEVASLAVQVHGGMGFIEETGVAQHYRDVRITTIYEGTNGIQAMDLVGRKLPMGGGSVIRSLFDRIEGIDDRLAVHPSLAGVRSSLADALRVSRETTQWIFEHAANPLDVLAGATPYLRVLATTTAGYLMARSAVVAAELLAEGSGDRDLLEAKIATGRFFCEQLLPAQLGHAAEVTAGADALMGFDAAALSC
jgi:hypothetical protein